MYQHVERRERVITRKDWKKHGRLHPSYLEIENELRLYAEERGWTIGRVLFSAVYPPRPMLFPGRNDFVTISVELQVDLSRSQYIDRWIEKVTKLRDTTHDPEDRKFWTSELAHALFRRDEARTAEAQQ